MTNLKVPEIFKPVKDLEKKIEVLEKKVEALGNNCIISMTCCKNKNHNIILKFENGIPVSIICESYKHPDYEYSCWEGSEQECIYLSGFKSLKEENYKK